MADRPRVVLACVILLQAAARPKSAAAKCLELSERGSIRIFVSEETLTEIQEVLERPEIRAQFPDLNDEVVEAFVKRLQVIAEFVAKVPRRFRYERDEDDEPYINLAIAVDSSFLVSRDHDLLQLMSGHADDCKEFRQRHRSLKVVTPEDLLNQVSAT